MPLNYRVDVVGWSGLRDGITKAILALLLALACGKVWAAPITLGQAAGFGVLAGTTVTNTGGTVVYGNVGISPGSAITGFPAGSLVGGALHLNDSIATQAQLDLAEAYGVIAGETPTQNLTGQDLGGLTLTPGVYRFDSSAQLTGVLTLDALGDPAARFDFQIGSTLTTASASTVSIINGGSQENLFFQVGSSATLGTNSAFAGNILALTSITLNTGATIAGGRALAQNGAVTLDTNLLGVNSSSSAPEPSTVLLLCVGAASVLGLRRQRG